MSLHACILGPLHKLQVMSFKGVSALASHPAFDIVKRTVTDYLHCVLLGVAKALLKMWLDLKCSAHEFCIGKQVYFAFHIKSMYLLH